MYCAWRIPAHLRCTKCSILFHLMDICFLTCICSWQISHIQTFLVKVVGPGLGRGGSTQFAQWLESAVTAPPLVGCVVWSPSLWSPLASSTSINKLQVMQNAALRTATGCTQDTHIQHLHDETHILPIHGHLQLHASQYKHNIHHIPYTNTQHTSTLQG